MEPVPLEDRPVMTRSLLAAAHLVSSGYPILHVTEAGANRQPIYTFSPAARDLLDRFYRARDGILATLPPGLNALVYGGGAR